MKITCFAIILVVGLTAIHGAQLPRPNNEVGSNKDTLHALRSSLEKLIHEKRSALKSPANQKRDFAVGKRGQCNIKDFVFLFTSLPGIRDALFELGNPDDVIEIVAWNLCQLYGASSLKYTAEDTQQDTLTTGEPVVPLAKCRARAGDIVQSLPRMEKTLGKIRLFRKKTKDKITNLVASYNHAMGTFDTILTPFLQGIKGNAGDFDCLRKTAICHRARDTFTYRVQVGIHDLTALYGIHDGHLLSCISPLSR